MLLLCLFPHVFCIVCNSLDFCYFFYSLALLPITFDDLLLTITTYYSHYYSPFLTSAISVATAAAWCGDSCMLPLLLLLLVIVSTLLFPPEMTSPILEAYLFLSSNFIVAHMILYVVVTGILLFSQ